MNTTGRLALVSPILKCGLLKLEGSTKGYYCFFLVKDFLASSPEILAHSLQVRECIYTYVVPGRSKFPQFGGGGSEFGFELRNLQLVESKYIKGQVHTVQCTRVQ